MPRRYPPEVRRQVIELARSGMKVAQLVEAFEVSHATVYNWLKQESVDRGELEGLGGYRRIGRDTGSFGQPRERAAQWSPPQVRTVLWGACPESPQLSGRS